MSKPFNIPDWQAKQRLVEQEETINEAKLMIKPLSKNSSVRDDSVINLLNYYELVNELKAIHG